MIAPWPTEAGAAGRPAAAAAGSPPCRSWSPRSAGSAPSSGCRTAAGWRPGSSGWTRPAWAPAGVGASLVRLDWTGSTGPATGFAPTAHRSRSRWPAARCWSSWTPPGVIDVAAERARLGRDLAAAREGAAPRPSTSWATRSSSRRRPRTWSRASGRRRAAAATEIERIDGRHGGAAVTVGSSDRDRSRGRGRGPDAARTPLVGHVLDAIRGSDSPDVVPETSTVAGFAEFLAVEATLDRRWPETVIEPSLHRIAALVDLLGDPQRGYPVVHLTGTNGKTSTARMVDALLTEIGLRTGRYTSPHLQLATERISIDGAADHPGALRRGLPRRAPFVELVDAAERRRAVEVRGAHRDGVRRRSPTRRSRPAIVEVGLGGQLGRHQRGRRHGRRDHPDRRWTTPSTWAPTCWASPREKAGIIKPGCGRGAGRPGPAPVAAGAAGALRRGGRRRWPGRARSSAWSSGRSRSAGSGSPCRGSAASYDEIFLPLHGEHQAGNAALALAAAEALVGAGPQQPLDPDAVAGRVRRGRLARPAGAAGRRAGAPTVLADAAHNPHGARALAAALTSRVPLHPAGRRARRDGGQGRRAASCAELEPVLAEVVVTANSSPRAMDPDELGALAAEVFGADRVSVEPRLAEAVEQAGELAEEGGESGVGVVVTGSVVTAGEARTLFGKQPSVTAPPDPMKGLRGIFAATLVLEAIVVLLGLLLPEVGDGVGQRGSIAGLAGLMLVAAGLQRRPWGLGLALALQVATIACGLLVPRSALMGVIFAAGLGVPAVPAPGRGAPAGPRRAARAAGVTHSAPAGTERAWPPDPAATVPPSRRAYRGRRRRRARSPSPSPCSSPGTWSSTSGSPNRPPVAAAPGGTGRAGGRRAAGPRRADQPRARHHRVRAGARPARRLPGAAPAGSADQQRAAAEGVAHRRAGAARHRRLGRLRRRPLRRPRRAQGQHRQLQLRCCRPTRT